MSVWKKYAVARVTLGSRVVGFVGQWRFGWVASVAGQPPHNAPHR